jgi:TetR/AcrR family transcriptional regulator, tetracycline repressor protein
MVRKQAAAGVKERLSRERIVDCAIALADAEGLDAVTIRRLAQDQGVTPMALYWHFKDKERLLDGIAERLISQAAALVADGPDGQPISQPDQRAWDERLRGVLAAILTVFREHPALTDLVPPRILMCEPGLDLTEQALGLLREAGFGVEQSAQLAMHALNSVVSLVAAEPGRVVGVDAEIREQRLRTKKASLQAVSPTRYPNVLASVGHLVECGSETAYYELGLDAFMAGVRGLQPGRP